MTVMPQSKMQERAIKNDGGEANRQQPTRHGKKALYGKLASMTDTNQTDYVFDRDNIYTISKRSSRSLPFFHLSVPNQGKTLSGAKIAPRV